MLSLVVPTFNSKRTIKACINSILQLRYIEYEIILVDDGSKDGTSHINDKYANEYDNIMSLHQAHSGVSEARNLGIKYSSGSWVSFIDSDDTIKSKHLEKIYKLYANDYNGLIISNINIYGENIGLHGVNDKICNIKTFVNNNYPITKFIIMDNSGKIYNLKIIRKYNLKYISHLNYGEDFTFTMNFLMCIHNCHIIQTGISYYNYNVNSNSSIKNYDKRRFKNEMIILLIIKKFYSHFCLTTAALNLIKLKMADHILVNELYSPVRNKLHILYLIREKIYKYDLISNNKSHYKNVEYHIIKFLITPSSILLLFLFLKIIIIKRRIVEGYRRIFKISY